MKTYLFRSLSFAFSLLLLMLTSGAYASEVTHGTASWYSTECCKYNPDPKCPTASGRSLYDLERIGDEFAASWHYPLGTRVKVCSRDSGNCTVVTIRDRGPHKRLGRIIDLSKKSFSKIADTRKGIINVTVEEI